MLRRALLAILLGLGALAFSLEGTARLAQPLLRKQSPAYYYRPYIQSLTEPSESLLWSGKPHATVKIENSEGREVTYELNSLGWRDKEFQDAKAHVLVLGDSFTFGTGVPAEETYSSLLERAHPGAEFWNLGVMGYAPDQYAILAKRWFQERKWDAVILQISNNDLGDVEKHVWLARSGEPQKSGMLPERLAGKPRSLESRLEFLNLAAYFFALWSRSFPAPERLDEAMQRILLALNAVIEGAKARAVPLVVLQASDWGESAYGPDWGGSFRRDVRDLTAVQGVPMLEPHKEFSLEDFLPFPDLHWRVGGHARVAIQLTDTLKKLGFRR